MRTTMRVACPTCDGAGEITDDETYTGLRLCGMCMGLGFKDVDATAPVCDVQTHEVEGPLPLVALLR